MGIDIKSLRGMREILPDESYKWQVIGSKLSKIANVFGFSEIKLPILESSDLYMKGLGHTSDVVSKEMYTFRDKNNSLVTLRPEGTAGCVRALLNNKLSDNNKISKLWYYGPMFRYERPQKGRYRQFQQFGVEYFNNDDIYVELELISLTNKYWQALGLKDIHLEINTIGNALDRENYKRHLVDYFLQQNFAWSEDELYKLNNNPLRLLDSKNPKLQLILEKAPLLWDSLNDTSISRYKKICFLLDELNIKYISNPKLVRGLDYYNDFVFEWKSSSLGAQDAFCAGGRYDGLARQMSGNDKNDIPAAGFAIGVDRLALLVGNLLVFRKILIVSQENFLYQSAFNLLLQIRSNICEHNNSLVVDISPARFNMKKSLKYANNNDYDFVIIVTQDGLETNKVIVKDMRGCLEQVEVPLTNINEHILQIVNI